MREMTYTALIAGILIGVVFAAANAYVGLRVGMTVSASIPAAVMSMAILRGIMKRKSILENNMVQTIGSSGESLAAGVIFTVPALFIFATIAENAGDHAAADVLRPSFLEMTVWGAIGGLLGVFFMIPLRKVLIVKEHGKLPYPEGTACAEVLESGERGGASAKTVFWGLGVAAIYEFFRQLGFWAETARQRIPLLKTEASLMAEPALLGVGYILGIRVAGIMLGGGLLGWFVIIPAIATFGADLKTPVAPGTTLIADMSPGQIWTNYLRYIGAGAVVLGGLISLLKNVGTIFHSITHAAGNLKGQGTTDRTQRDLPMLLVLAVIVAIGAAMWFLPDIGAMHHVMKSIPLIACVIGFGFFFVTVSSRLVGIIGGSSNPASGMTIATILGTALIFVYCLDLGLGPTEMKFAILSVGALVCIAICLAGDCSQDLKTGFLVGATPWKQQIGEVIGVLATTAALAGLILLINNTFGFVKDEAHPNAFLAPQAQIMQTLVKGVVDQELPWGLILIGVAAALVVELLGMPSLPFSVGLYLPISLSTPIMVGGIIRWIVDKRRGEMKEGENPGILGASGMVAGQGLVGVLFVGVAAIIGFFAPTARFDPEPFRSNPLHAAAVALEAPSEEPVPAPTTQPMTSQPEVPEGESVVPNHLVPWLAGKVGIPPQFGLYKLDLEAGAFRGAYAFEWWHWLPLLPFTAMVIWLLRASLRRLPPAASISTSDPLPTLGTGSVAPSGGASTKEPPTVAETARGASSNPSIPPPINDPSDSDDEPKRSGIFVDRPQTDPETESKD